MHRRCNPDEGFRSSGSLRPLTRAFDALNAEQAKLESDYQDADELPDEVDQRLGEIEAALMAFERVWTRRREMCKNIQP